MIRKTLAETPWTAAEWIMWIDIDTIIPDMSVLPRFSECASIDSVLVCDEAHLFLVGDVCTESCRTAFGSMPARLPQ